MKFKVAGQVVDTAKEAQKLLGRGSNAKMRDIIEGKAEGVQLITEDGTTVELHDGGDITEVIDEATEFTAEATLPDEVPVEPTEDTFMDTVSDAENARKAQEAMEAAEEVEVAKTLTGQGTKVITPIDDEIEYPEKGTVKDEKAISKFIKKLKDIQVYEWAELEGLTWKRCPEHEPIDRMRAVMAIKAYHFPPANASSKGKSKSKYADMTNEALIALAAEKGIAVKDAKGDAKIQRMYTIMALRTAGLLA